MGRRRTCYSKQEEPRNGNASSVFKDQQGGQQGLPSKPVILSFSQIGILDSRPCKN